MANLTETPTYEAGIYRFETTDPVQGGPGGIDNLPTNQLANRTAWLKAQVEAILLDIAAIESGYATDAELATHTGNTSNPHAASAAARDGARSRAPSARPRRNARRRRPRRGARGRRRARRSAPP